VHDARNIQQRVCFDGETFQECLTSRSAAAVNGTMQLPDETHAPVFASCTKH